MGPEAGLGPTAAGGVGVPARRRSLGWGAPGGLRANGRRRGWGPRSAEEPGGGPRRA